MTRADAGSTVTPSDRELGAARNVTLEPGVEPVLSLP